MKIKLLTILVLGSTVMAGCSTSLQDKIDGAHTAQSPSASSASTPSSALTPSSASTSPSMPADHALPGEEGETEVQQLPNRAAVAFKGGVRIYDPHSGELLETLEVDGNPTLAQTHDGRHVMVLTGSTARLLDMGLVARPHGNHFHYYTAAPKFTDLSVPAGKVTNHDGLTAVARYGVQVYNDDFSSPVTTVADATNPAYAFPDGSVLAAKNEETLALFDASGKVKTETTDCLRINGSATLDETVIFTCMNGVVSFDGGKFSTIEGAPAATAVSTSEESTIIATDDLLRHKNVQLIDMSNKSVRTVELPEPLVPGQIARGPLGEVLALTKDRTLSTIDPDSGEVTSTVEAVVGIMVALDGYAFVLDPVSRRLLDVDLYTNKVLHRHLLDFRPTDMVVL